MPHTSTVKKSAAEKLSFCSQPTALVIGESKAFTTEMLQEDPILLLRVMNDGLLVPVDPAVRGDYEQQPAA